MPAKQTAIPAILSDRCPESRRWSLHRNPRPTAKTPRNASTQEHRPRADGKWPEVQIARPRSGSLILFAYPCCHHAGYNKKSCATK